MKKIRIFTLATVMALLTLTSVKAQTREHSIINCVFVEGAVEDVPILVGHYNQVQNSESMSLKEWEKEFGFVTKEESFSLMGKPVSEISCPLTGKVYDVAPDQIQGVMKHDGRYFIIKFFTDWGDKGDMIVSRISVKEIRYANRCRFWKRKTIEFNDILLNSILAPNYKREQ